MVRAVMEWGRALREHRCLPSGVFGPVEWVAWARLAARARGESCFDIGSAFSWKSVSRQLLTEAHAARFGSPGTESQNPGTRLPCVEVHQFRKPPGASPDFEVHQFRKPPGASPDFSAHATTYTFNIEPGAKRAGEV